MKPAAVLACVLTLWFGGCSWFPRAGPSTNEVLEQGRAEGEILFDVVEVDDQVISTLLSQPTERFARRFGTSAQPPEVKIAIGDTVAALIWESGAGGLFTEAPPSLPPAGPRTGVEPLAPEAQPPSPERRDELATPGPPVSPTPGAATPQQEQPRRSGNPQEGIFSAEASGVPGGRSPAIIPEQQVGADGAISVPYAGRIPAAGRTPAELQQMIEARLAEKALQPQALVIVTKSAANTVTVILNEAAAPNPGGVGENSVENLLSSVSSPVSSAVAGARVPLSIGGDRLLQVIAAAGGAKTPVHDTFVQLSRDGVTATIPLQQLVSDPAEDIYAQPGDVLTLTRVPQTFSVFGATGRNAEIPFGAERINLAEALGKSQGLRDDLAKPEGVFLFRYEPNSVVRALDEPIATRALGDVSPIVYRFNLKDGKAYLLAQQFPMQDKDVIFVADAPAARFYNFATVLNNVTGPIITGLLVCRGGRC